MRLTGRVTRLEEQVGRDLEGDDCPLCAIGVELEDGTFESDGRIYTAEDIERCFGPGKGLFVVLDEGPPASG